MQTLGCGLERIMHIDSAQPDSKLVFRFPGNWSQPWSVKVLRNGESIWQREMLHASLEEDRRRLRDGAEHSAAHGGGQRAPSVERVLAAPPSERWHECVLTCIV